MSFLRRLLGGGNGDARDEKAPADPPLTDAQLAEAETARERELVRDEAARMDELQQRQLRYADRAWTPPAQGGERRADDADAEGDRAGS